MRRNPDRTPANGTPRFRITIELPALWDSYLVNRVPDTFEDAEPDDPWNRAAADRAAADLENQGYVIVGLAAGAETEFGRYDGTSGGICEYEAVNRDVLAADADAGLWRFIQPHTESEYLILQRGEGIVWLPENWRHKLADPACEIDEADLVWPHTDADPNHPAPADVDEMPRDWRCPEPPPQDLDAWNGDAYRRNRRGPRRPGAGRSTRPSTEPASDGSSAGGDPWRPTSPPALPTPTPPTSTANPAAQPSGPAGARCDQPRTRPGRRTHGQSSSENDPRLHRR